MAEYEVRRAGIRLTEPTAKSRSVERLNLEGVIEELSAAATADRSRVKEYLEGQSFMGLEEWSDYTRDQRESTVTAVAAAQLPGRHV